jgi:heme A synthase
MFTAAIFIVTAITFVAALLRTPRRRDLIVLTGLLGVGIAADAVLGAFVVYSKLNPWLVSLHLLLSLSMVVIAAVLYHRSKYLYGPGARADIRDPHFHKVAKLLWIPFVILTPRGFTRRRPCCLSASSWDCCSRSGRRVRHRHCNLACAAS